VCPVAAVLSLSVIYTCTCGHNELGVRNTDIEVTLRVFISFAEDTGVFLNCHSDVCLCVNMWCMLNIH
jgi:hypothetical protein